MPPVVRTLPIVFAFSLLACGGSDPGGGPRSRVKHFTGCEVPSGAVRVHDHITGDDASYVAWVKLVVPKDRIDALVTSCGLEREALVQGYPTLAAPEERLPWWNPPEPDAMLGGELREDGRRVELQVLERDTDFAFYARSESPAPAP
ncbi:MAG: hypothetical protein CMN31_17960 [Sandaracinus sp.]|nr:hypothetical protein [Sandaracinus sp.]MBJ73189.1 hypothetical protein [Sandaracinus sp.]